VICRHPRWASHVPDGLPRQIINFNAVYRVNEKDGIISSEKMDMRTEW